MTLLIDAGVLLLCCGWRAAVLWKARVLAGLFVLVGCLGGWLACEQAVGWWRVTGVRMVCVWWVAVCLMLRW